MRTRCKKGMVTMTIRKSEINEKNLCTVEFSEDAATLEAEKSKVFHEKSKNFNIPGFRRGKAPRSIIEKMYGTGVFLEDAINNIINAHYPEIVDAAGKQVVSRPEFDIVSMDENEIVLKAEMYVKPDVTIEGYKGIEASVVLAPVTDEEIDREIMTVRERNAREIEITDRPAEMGDTAVIDYEGFVDGVAFDGGKDSGHHLKLGSGQFIPGFEEGIVGKNVGEEFDVNVTFPEQYGAAELAGKAAVFKVKLNALEKTELPEADDDFAVDVSEFNTFAEYRADLASKIEKRHKDNADNELSEKVEDALAEKLVAEIPESMVDSEVEAQVRESESRMQMQGLQLSMYLKYFNMTLDQYKEQIRPSALKHVKTELALEKIAELESVEVSEDEINAEYETIAKVYSVEVDYAKENLPAEEIKHTLVMRKTLALVKDAAKVTYLDKAPEAPAPAEAE